MGDADPSPVFEIREYYDTSGQEVKTEKIDLQGTFRSSFASHPGLAESFEDDAAAGVARDSSERPSSSPASGALPLDHNTAMSRLDELIKAEEAEELAAALAQKPGPPKRTPVMSGARNAPPPKRAPVASGWKRGFFAPSQSRPKVPSAPENPASKHEVSTKAALPPTREPQAAATAAAAPPPPEAAVASAATVATTEEAVKVALAPAVTTAGAHAGVSRAEPAPSTASAASYSTGPNGTPSVPFSGVVLERAGPAASSPLPPAPRPSGRAASRFAIEQQRQRLEAHN
jgi:hypothetical protein